MTCPKCNKSIHLDISKALDEDGEVFKCPNCKWIFRFAIR